MAICFFVIRIKFTSSTWQKHINFFCNRFMSPIKCACLCRILLRSPPSWIEIAYANLCTEVSSDVISWGTVLLIVKTSANPVQETTNIDFQLPLQFAPILNSLASILNIIPDMFWAHRVTFLRAFFWRVKCKFPSSWQHVLSCLWLYKW